MSASCCAAITAEGRPCRNWRVNAEGLCWRHDGRPTVEGRRRQAVDTPRVCGICERFLPARLFWSIALDIVHDQRPRADQAHVAAQHIPKFRQFIQAGLAQHPAQRRYALHIGQHA